jgi:hypothetical protein
MGSSRGPRERGALACLAQRPVSTRQTDTEREREWAHRSALLCVGVRGMTTRVVKMYVWEAPVEARVQALRALVENVLTQLNYWR